jgi:hypothetical protein
MSHWLRVSLIPLLCTCLLVPAKRKQILPDNKMRIASAISRHFETVFYAQGELLTSSGRYRNLSKQDSNSLRAPFAYLLSGLAAAAPRVLQDVLRGEEVFVGAKGFLPPEGLGSVHFQYCYVVVFDSLASIDLRIDFNQEPVASVDGLPIWHWTARLGEFGEDDPKSSSFYIAQIKPYYVLVSNNLSDLRTILQQMISSDADSVLIPRREWEFIVGHELWGYRRYHGGSDGVSSGLSGIATDAEALIFTVGAEDQIVKLRLIASDQRPADKLNADAEMAKAKLPDFHAAGPPGVWETEFALSGDRLTSERIFEMMGLFGLGSYL